MQNHKHHRPISHDNSIIQVDIIQVYILSPIAVARFPDAKCIFPVLIQERNFKNVVVISPPNALD